MAGAILILLWVQHEVSYEKFDKNADSIYLIVWERLANNRHYESSPAPFADRLNQDFPEFENIVRLSLHKQHVVKYRDKIFAEKQITVADPSLFQMFTFPLLQGDAARKALIFWRPIKDSLQPSSSTVPGIPRAKSPFYFYHRKHV